MSSATRRPETADRDSGFDESLHLDTPTVQWQPNPMRRGLTSLPLTY